MRTAVSAHGTSPEPTAYGICGVGLVTAEVIEPTPWGVSYREYGLDFPAEPESVFVVRANVRATCSVWRVPQEATDTMTLLASETVTNAIAVSPGEVLRFTLRRVLGYLYFDCLDYHPVIPLTPSMPGDGELSGRGLALTEELSSSYGWKRLPQAQGKIRWFTLAVE